jgi:hypothetical protein
VATATLKFNPNNAINSGVGSPDSHTVIYYGTISFSAVADVYLTGGIAPLAGFAPKNLGPYSDRVPLAIYIESQSGSGFEYKWNQATGKLQVFSGTGAGATSSATELTNNTALNATTPTISTDVINYVATFPRV